MPKYRYRATTAEGRLSRGRLEAESIAAARNQLLGQGLQVTALGEKKGVGEFEITKKKVALDALMHLSRQLASFVRAGIPLVQAVEVIGEDSADPMVRQILVDIAASLRSGDTFSEAIGIHQGVFPDYYVKMLRSAELTGRLDTVLEQLANYIERDLDARRNLKSALTYPAVVLVMAIATVLVIVSFVLPRFKTFFASFDARLPLPTRMLLWIARFVSDWWFALVGGAAMFGVLLVLMVRTERGLRFRDRTMLRLPLVGGLVRDAVVERFCRVLGAMLRAGVTIPDAMAAAIDGSNNRVYGGALRRARDDMLQGEGIAGPLTATGLFPAAACQMLRVGENTGTLDRQLEAASDFYSQELNQKLKRLTALFEPAIVVFVGVVVGFVALAMVSAMYGIFKQVPVP